MIYLSDNDIVEKLAVCNLLDDTLASFEATRSDVYVIPTLRHRIGGKVRTKAEKRLGSEAVERILNFLDEVQVIKEYSAEDHQLLDDVVGIDPGETILLAATAVFPDCRLLTGDKRCLRTVATCPECESIARRIQGRVVCFEQVLCHLIDHFGFDHVLAKVVPVLSCDNALRAAFGSGIQSTKANSVACLQSYIGELRALPIDLLVGEA